MNFDKIKRLPLFLFTAYFAKILFLSHVGWVDGAILLVLASLAGFYEAWSQISEMKELGKQLKKLEDAQVKLEKDNQDLKTYVTGLKLGQQIRMGSSGR